MLFARVLLLIFLRKLLKKGKYLGTSFNSIIYLENDEFILVKIFIFINKAK